MSHPTEVARIVTVGGKGTSLSSSAVYAVATGSATVRLDSSALDRLPNHAAAGSDPKLRKPEPPIPKTLDPVAARAYLVLLLSKLLPCRGVPASLPVVIADALNSGGGRLPVVDIGELAEDVCRIVETSGAELYGICALVDHESAALAAVVGAVASLSCEASKADMAAACSLTDTGDGLVNKEQALVASDLRVLLNGSKFVGKVKSDAFARIPAVIGKFREVVKSVHYNTRVELNSPAEGNRGIAGEAICEVIHSLVFVLRRLGESSLLRSKMNLNAVGDDGLKSSLLVLFEKNFGEGDLMSAGCKSAFDSYMRNDYENFVHAVKCLLGDVWRIVTWEGISALFAIEGWELIGKKGDEGPDANGEDAKGDKKADKKKKKKAVLGKGTGQIVQWIKDKVQNKGGGISDSSKVLEKWVEDLVLFFDPKDPGFDGFINKVKEVLESNESRRLPKLPKGTRDFAKEQMAIREKAFSIISGVFKRHGATALDTPVFEMRETLMGKYGEDSKLIYDLADQGGELCSLRYDLTVPFARYVAMNGITTLKRYQIAKVYRRDNPSKGRYREFYQCDFDIAGQFLRMGPDFEIIRILTELLDALDIGDYEVKLNHRKLLDGMLEICGVPAEKFRTICSSIDKLDKQSFEQVKKEMVEEKGLSIEVADRIGNFVKEKGSPKELLSKLKQEGSKFLENASSKFALEDLEILFEALDKSKCINKVVFDLSLARGLDYYTGVIFEAVFKGTTQVGSIAAGGRYDNLIGMFGTKQVPAVGVSLGIERVFAIMEQIQKEQNQTTRATETEVLLSILGNESKLPLAAEQVSALWDANVKAEYEISTRFSKHIDRARDSRIPWMVLVGDKELEKGVVKLKNVETTVEEEIPAGSLVEQLRSRLNR